MPRSENDRAAQIAEWSRRDFLRAGATTAGALGLSLAGATRLDAVSAGPKDINCILLMLVGGPSQLDTWDLKPDAPSSVRGPFRPIRTNVASIDICEHFPRMAAMAHRYALVRSVHHREAPIHETGQQMMQTGRLFSTSRQFPHFGSTLAHLRGARSADVPPFVVVPGPIGNTGVTVSHGQTAGYLGSEREPVFGAEQPVGTTGSELERYGATPFGQNCLLARQLIERGVRFVTVNMFTTVFNEVTWDCHADHGSLATTLDDYKTTLCPTFDLAYSALLDDLDERGLLKTTLVLAMGEFGRTPLLNPRGGRDHWPGCWTVLFAGAGVRGGQVIGSSDRTGSEPRDCPVTPAHIAASVYAGLGIDMSTRLPSPDGQLMPIVQAEPIGELFV